MGQKGVAQKGKGIADKGKGKAVAENGPSGAKRKRDDGKEKSGVSDGWRRNDSGVLRFFDDAAAEADGSDASDENDFLNDFMEEDLDTAPQVNSIPGNSYNIPVIPKEEEMDEDEFDKMMEERYKNSSAFFSYAENDYENKRSIDRNSMIPSEKDPVIWKVKCSVGRERYLAFCLMQKYVDLKEIGTKLQIISALSVEHVKGFIFVEADKQFDISEACNGIGGVYASRVMPVPRNEVARLLTVRSEYNEISAGMWARVKNGKYKGDLGQVVAVNNSRKRAIVKLIPRIDLLALTEKYGGGITTTKRTSNAAPRLISSSELEEFRPLIQIKHDRETGKIYEVLDGMMIKDGFLFKKIPLDSLSCWNVVPSEEEILKFKSSENIESDNIEWLSQLYGERKKKKVNNDVQLQGKGESSLGPISTNSFEVHDLVCFGRKDFGVIIGMEKDDSYKILKEGLDCPLVVTVQQSELKSGPSDMKFTALDHRMKSITVNDTVRVTEGPFEGKQGIVKLIYRGIIFLYDQNEEENGGYFCCKSRICEKIKLSIETFNEKGKDSGGVGFEDFFSSPKSPLSPEKPQQAREFNRDFNKTDNDETFSIGQALRIRVGPLKGYRCRVLAIRRSDVTVKLESKQKVLTVKREHLSEVKTRSSVVSLSEDPGSSSFDMLGNEGGSREGGAGGASDGWDVGGSSSERSSWPTTSASGFSVQPDSGWGNASSSNDEVKTDVEDAWASKVTPKKNLSWGAEAVDTVKVGWGTSMDSQEKGSSNDASASWGKKNSSSNSAGGWGDATTEKNQSVGWGQSLDSKEKDSSNDVSASWGKKNNVCGSQDHEKPSEDPWDKVKNASNKSSGGWGATTEENQSLGWEQGMDSNERDSSNDFSASWEKKNVNSNQDHGKPSKDPWGNGKNTSNDPAGAWGDAATEENKQDSWGKGKNVVGGGIWESKSGFSASKDGFNDMSKQKTWDARSDASTWGNDQKARSDASTWGNDRQSQDKGWGKRSAGNSEPGGNEDACWSKKSNWNSDPGDMCGGQDSRWGKKSNRNSESGGSDLDRNSAWGKISACFSDGGGKQNDKSECNNGNVWNAKSDGITGNQDSGWGCKSNWNFESGGTGGGSSGNKDLGWGNKSNWNSESGGTGGGFTGNKDSGWGNKSNWNSESGGIGGGSSGNQDSGWGNKSNWNSESGGTGGGSSGNNDSGWSDKSNWNSESGGTDGGSSGNKDLGWGNKSNWNFESGGTDGGSGGNQDSGWGNKSNWNSESGGNGGGSGGNQDLGWGNKSNWNSKSGGDFSKNQDAGWGNKSNWNSKSGGTEGNHSAWGQKSNWNSEFSNADQKSNWGSKSNWSSGIAWENKSTDAGSEDQTEAISSRPSGGNWRGGRGGFGVRGGDRGGFGGRGRDGGGFGSRGGDRGRFCGRGGDRGGFRGRGRSDRESFGGGGGDRGGFGGRGRGRRDLSGGWNNRDYGGNGSWQNKGERDSGEGSNGAGSGNQGGGQKSEWQGGTAGSWSQSAAGKDGAIWGKGTGSSSGAGGGWGNIDQEGQGGTLGSAETKNSSGGWSTQGSSWSQSAAVKDCGSWGKGAGSSSGAGGGWGNKDQEAGCKGPNSTTQAGMWATGSDSSTGHGGSWGNNSKSPGASGGAQWGNSNNSDQNGGWKGQNSGSWSKGTGSSSGAGGWGNKDQEAGWQGLDSTATDSSTGKGGGSWGNNSKSPGASGGAQWGSSNATGQDGGWKGQNSGSWKGQNSGSWSKGTGTSTGGGGSWGNDGKSAGASGGSQWPMSTPSYQEGPSAQAGDWDKGSGSNTTGGVSWGNNGKAPDASTNEDGGWKGPSSTVKAGGWGNQGSDGNSGGLGADSGSKSTEPWGKAADKSWGSGGGKGGW